MLGAHSVLATGQRIPSGELWAGNPARKVRHLSGDEQTAILEGAARYWKIANEHIDEFYLPVGTNYIEAEQIDAKIGHRVWEDPTPASSNKL